MGCYKDERSDRELWFYAARDEDAMTIPDCNAACQGYKYFGLEVQ